MALMMPDAQNPWIAKHLVLGTMYFGTKTAPADAFALMDRYVAAGGAVLDTANCYAFWANSTGAGGQSESAIGEWLRANPGVRERLTIATKVAQEPKRPGDFTEWEGLAPEVIAAQFERSRERLGVDVVDLYWAHGEDRTVPLDEVVAAMGALVTAGQVKRLGASNHATWRVERARTLAQAQGVEPWTALQLTTSYVHPRPDAPVPGKDHRFGFVSEETIDYLETHPEMEAWAYSPLIQGSYDRADRPFPGSYHHPGTDARLAALREVAVATGARPGQVVLSWLVQSSPRFRPIIGVSSLAQLDAALSAPRLSPEQLAHLDAG